jgi:PAS domain S-box-containing protein
MREVHGALVVGDLRLSALRAPIPQAEGMVSLIVAPIGAPRRRYGLLGACSRTSDAFEREDVAFLESMANTLAGAVERGRSADDVLRREAQLNEAQRLSDIGSWEINVDTGAVAASEHLRDMLAVGDAPLRVEALYARVYDQDQARVREYTSALVRGGAEPIEFRIVGPEGAVRTVRSETTEVSVRESGERTMQGTLQDVTDARRTEGDLRRSEERFRQGFDNAPIGMTLIDPGSGRYLRVNAAYCHFVGRSAEQLLTLTYRATVHPDDVDDLHRRTFGDGHSAALVTEGRYLRPDGSVVWGAISASRVLGPDGDVDVLFSQIVDITERRGREDAVRRDIEQIAWLKEISAALGEDRFELHGQPIVDLATGATIQHELLVRMRSPAGELIPPGEFLPAAEQYGLIRDIDRWVISRGAEIAATGMDVEINLSGTSMSDAGAIEDIDRALERTGADPSRLVFEITETAAIEDVDNARRLAHGLRDRGCRFALDDFGTGFSGMSSLKALPLDYLKIDREFVKDLCVSEPDRHVLVATINLARAFGLQTIAEGVEDQPTLDVLSELGVDYAQGYFLGRPALIAP